MADDQPVWGIEIGQAALKAIKLRPDPASGRVVAEAFDLVKHPKILSQPDANPGQLIPEAMETFLGRNSLKGCRVAVSLPGQSALARFIQLPPVESSQIGKIVEYEARQQIPFALEEVIWDYQPLGGGTEEGGYTLEAEVGLFAMKRDQVETALAPFVDRKIEVDLVQIAPLGLYNFLTYDRLGVRPGKEFDAPDEYTIVCDMGADNSTLLISNGDKIWIRNVNVGGNHFTRALVKDQKLTFAKAEHLKCNATKAPDPRAVFQALRPVFNDYVAEIQRSIGYFSSVNRDAKITKVLGVGNGFKLAGLQKFLQQNLRHPVERVDRFQGVVGDAVLNDDVFRDNVAGFVVPYGIALQAAGQTRITTSLIPPEIVQERKIRQKKPWAALAAGTLLAGIAVSGLGYGSSLAAVSEDRWGGTEREVAGWNGEVGALKSDYDAQLADITKTAEVGVELTSPVSGRGYWPEVYRAISAVLPGTPGEEKDVPLPEREEVRIDAVTFEKTPDLTTWFAALEGPTKQNMAAEDLAAGPAGEGYVVTLTGVHYHDEGDPETRSVGYLRNTVMKNLREWTVTVDGATVPVGKIGISHPALEPIVPSTETYDPTGRTTYAGGGGRGGGRPGGGLGGMGLGGGLGFGGGDPSGGQGDRRGAGEGGGFGGAGEIGGFGKTGGRGGSPGPGGRPNLSLDLNPDEPAAEPVTVTSYPFTLQFVWQKIPPADRTAERPAVDPAAADPLADPAAPAADGV